MTTETATWVGQTLAGGRYRVTDRLGEGGMGFVYRAHDRNLDAEVVIKAPRRAMMDHPGFATRFAREIRALVKLVHPHVVKVMDVGEHEGLPFAVMQYLSGGSLRDRQPAGPDGSPAAMPAEELRGWVEAVAGALDFIHAKGYLHRDVKPDNILFDADGQAYLSDFGVAKVLADQDGGAKKTVVTGENALLGTPQYMAPELLLGEPCDGRADQYALGVMAYELLSGRYPFDGPTPPAIFLQKATQEPPPLESLCPSVPAPVAAAVHKALARRPADRFPDCASLARALLDGLSGAATRTPSSRATSSPATKVACPGCKKTFALPSSAEGKRLRCPACGQTFQAPTKPRTATRPGALPEAGRVQQPPGKTRTFTSPPTAAASANLSDTETPTDLNRQGSTAVFEPDGSRSPGVRQASSRKRIMRIGFSVGAAAIALVGFAAVYRMATAPANSARKSLAEHPATEAVAAAVNTAERPPSGTGSVKPNPAATPPRGQAGPGPAKPETPPPGGGKQSQGWVALADTPEQFKAHWRPGNPSGTVFYDRDKRAIDIKSIFGMGTLVYDAPWQEFEFEILVKDMYRPGFKLEINGITLDISGPLVKAPRPKTVSVKYDPESETAVGSVDGAPVSRATVLDGKWANTFHCILKQDGGWGCDVTLGKLRLRARGAEPPVKQESRPPAAGQPRPQGWVPLADSPEQFKAHWRAGNPSGTVFYDRDKRAIDIKSIFGMGTLVYDAPWQEFEFEVLVKDMYRPGFRLEINGITLDISGPLVKAPRPKTVSVKYDPESETAVGLVDGATVSRATVLDRKWADKFHCVLKQDGGWGCEVTVSKLRLRTR